MIKRKVILVFLSLLFFSRPIISTEQPIEKKASPFSFQTIRENPKKTTAGYIGYWTGAIGSWVIATGFHPTLFLPSLIMTPISGSLGASMGVYSEGTHNNQNGSFVKTVYGGAKGSLYGFWTWLLPIPFVNPFVLNPAHPVLYSIDAYNESITSKSYQSKNHQLLSIDPIRAIWGIGRLVGLSKEVDTPIIIEYERKTNPSHTIGVIFQYQNQTVEATEWDTLLGVRESDTTQWLRKHYRLSAYFRHYHKSMISGPYSGLGVSLIYSSLSEIKGDLRKWDQYEGNSFFIMPFGELGYHLNLTSSFFIKGGIQVGPVISINPTGQHHKTLQDKPYNSIYDFLSSSFYIRSGFHW